MKDKTKRLAGFRLWHEMLRRLARAVPTASFDNMRSDTARHRKSKQVLRRRKANKAARLARRRNR